MQSDHIYYSYSKCRITFKHTCKHRHRFKCECCQQGDCYVEHVPRCSVGSAKLSDTVVYLFDFLFMVVGAEEEVCLPPPVQVLHPLHLLPFNSSGYSV